LKTKNEGGKESFLSTFIEPSHYAPDLLKDRFHVVVSKYFFLITIASAVILFDVGGWSKVLRGIFLC
jgi:hypothetical protein